MLKDKVPVQQTGTYSEATKKEVRDAVKELNPDMSGLDRVNSPYLPGNISVKQLPFPISEETVMVPPCRFMICLHKLSPMPDPDGLVVKNGTNTLSITSGRMPSPLSRTVRLQTFPGTCSNSTSICGAVFCPQDSLAFLIRLISTCSIWARSMYRVAPCVLPQNE